MANFQISFQKTIIGNEGGYNPGIGEHETYKGIDRGANPRWSGWAVIDRVKQNNPGAAVSELNALFAQNTALQSNIWSFYKANYWDVVNLDNVNDQQLANNLFDCSVNQGSGEACKFLQLACNAVISDTQSDIAHLTVDRIIGHGSLNAINTLPPANIMAEINAERTASYRLDSGYAEWGKVWISRLNQYQA
jgi:lysozyme family protein